jgi:hypothetical protein
MKRLFTLLVAILAVGCAGPATDPALDLPPNPLTWEEFKAGTYQEPDTGMYISNGDELIETEELLREQYDRYLAAYGAVKSGSEIGTSQDSLIVNLVNGRDDKWSSSAALNITYCISSSSFGSRYSSVVSAMNSATGAWEATARVNFVHASQYDGNCTKTTGVVFNVRQVCTGQYLARAFFPSTSRSGREILIDCTSFGNISPYTLTGVLRHELGHALGFRHEHTRPESGTCYENSSWRALTSYDSASVMHYPQCNGTNNGDLVLTTKDKSGAKALYP